MKGKRGISLITLIITIIVIIILAGAIILSINNTNIIGNANKAVYDQDRESLIDTYKMLTMDKFVANSTKDEPIGNIDISELYTKIGKDLGDNFKVENNNLLEKQEDGSYDIIAKFPNSGSNGESTPVEPSKPEVGVKATQPTEWGEEKEDVIPTYVKNGNEFAVIPVPQGFVVSKATEENDINNGVVIYKGEAEVNDGNKKTEMKTRDQYVWVPVDGSKVTYSRYDWDLQYGVHPEGNVDTSENLNVGDLPGFTEAEVKESVNKYKGFYIGRYEASTDTIRNSRGDALTAVMCVQDKPVYNYVAYDQAVGIAKEVLKLKNVKSGLITGAQWDTALKFIATKDEYKNYPTDSTGKGNYIDSDSNNNPAKTGDTKYTQYVLNNIYDMAGNTWEWTNENYLGSSNRIYRGGDYNVSGSDCPARYRNDGDPSSSNVYYSFRLSLYIK